VRAGRSKLEGQGLRETPLVEGPRSSQQGCEATTRRSLVPQEQGTDHVSQGLGIQPTPEAMLKQDLEIIISFFFS
jgi:hypothetical protein